MLMDRIMGALTFKREVYAEVEHDESFTGTAWGLVVVVAFLSQLGALALAEDFSAEIIGTVIGTAFSVLGFAVGAFAIAWVGKALFQAEVTFDEVVRTVGLAYIWNILGVFGVLAAFVPLLVCILSPALFLGWVLGLYSWFIATREALDLETGQTIITVIIGFVAVFIVSGLAGTVLAFLGLGAAAAAGAL